jgi:hypothetical protein
MLERLNLLLQAASVLLLFAGFAFGTATIVVGYLLGKRQETRIAAAKAEAAAANERSLKLELKAAEQQERAANAEAELLTIQKNLAPRELTGDERARFIGELKADPKCEVWVISNRGQGEATGFAKVLVAAFCEAGWNAKTLLAPNDQLAPGIGIAQAIEGPKTPCVLAIENAFRTVGFDPYAIGHSDSAKVIEVLVGPKP